MEFLFPHASPNTPMAWQDAHDRHGAYRILRATPEASASSTTKPCVSVLLSVRNAGAAAETAMRSVLEQNVDDLELLVADDGSTDDTPGIIEALAMADTRIIMVRQPNLGLTRTLNRLLALSRGEFVARQDADDLWLPGKLRMQLARMQADPSLVLLGTRFLIADAAGTRRSASPHMDITGDAALRDALACYNPFMHASVLMRGDVLRQCNGYDERYDVAQDYELWLRLARLGTIDVLDTPACVRREEDTPVARRKAGRQRRNVLLAKLRHGAWMGHGVRPLYFLLKDAAAACLRAVPHRWARRIRPIPVPESTVHAAPMREHATAPRPFSVLFCTVRADWGGGPEHLYQLLRHLPAGVEAHVACPPGDEPYARRFANLVGDGRCLAIPHRAFSLAALLRMVRYVRANRIDVLHSHGKGAGLYVRLAALLSGKPCVHTFHGLHLDHYGRMARLAYATLERALGLATARCITVSGSERQRVLAERFCPPGRVVTIPNGVVMPDAPARPAAGPPFPVVHISRFDVAKNSAFIVSLLAELRRRRRHGDFTFIVVGEGDGRAPVQEALRGMGLEDRVEFTGFQRVPARYFEGALCYLSCSRWEGMPLSVMEALAHGLPAIASDVRGNVDVVLHDLNGLLYPLDDAPAAAGALCALADDPMLARRLADAAREHALKHFDARDMSNTTYSVLRDAAHAAKE